MNKIRLLVLSWRDIKNPLAGGAEKYIHEICRWLVRNGHEVIFFTSSFQGAKGEEVIDGVKIIRRGHSIKVYLLAFMFYVLHWKGKFDCVVEAKDGGLPWFTRFYAGKRAIALVHQTGRDFGSRSYLNSTWRYEVKGMTAPLMYLLEPFFLSIYRLMPVITVSHSTKTILLELGLHPNNVAVVHPGTDLNLPQRIPDKETSPTIIYLGRIKRSKRLFDLIEALFYVRKKIQDVKLWVVGRGDSSYLTGLRQFIDKLGLANSTTFFGYVDEKTKTNLLSRSHLLVFPSVREGWGITVIEANACGTPAIAYNVPGLRDSIINNETGLLAESGDVEDLAEKIVTVLEDAGLREKLSRNALEYAKQFSWDKTAEEFMKVVEWSVNER
ncbi:MAG: glycosyltransferase family 4 protein [Candidatus Jordarchaeaceae archaeon]